jgi:hypothetical protein
MAASGLISTREIQAGHQVGRAAIMDDCKDEPKDPIRAAVNARIILNTGR